MINLNSDLLRQIASIGIAAAQKAGADSPAFASISGALSSLLGHVPELAGEKVQLDGALDDAIKSRKAAGERARAILRAKS